MPRSKKEDVKMEQVKLTLPQPIVQYVDDVMQTEGFLSRSHVFLDALKYWRDERERARKS